MTETVGEQPTKKKRKKPATLKSFSSKHLRSLGWTVGDVERHVGGFISFDLFGIADLLAFRSSQPGSVLIQVTHCDRASDHRKTILASEHAIPWLRCGNRILLHLWDKRGPRGGLKTWTLFEHEFVEVDGQLSEIGPQKTEK